MRAEGPCAPTACVSDTVTVNTLNSVGSVSVGSSPICPGQPSVLTMNGGSLGTGANWVWYANGCGTGAPIGTGISITVHPTSSTSYYARAEGGCNTTPCAIGTVNTYNNSVPASAVTGASAICIGGVQILLFPEGR